MLDCELSGEHGVKLDDMSRISLPRQLRDIVEKSQMVLLRGEQPCLWLYTVEQWKFKKEKAIINNPSLLVRRRFNAKQAVEMDKQGRILIPSTLREYAKLSKDCIVVGQDDYIEIWAKDRYDEYIEATGEDFKVAWEELSAPQLNERDLGNGGDRSFSGTAGTDIAVSGTEGQ